MAFEPTEDRHQAFCVGIQGIRPLLFVFRVFPPDRKAFDQFIGSFGKRFLRFFGLFRRDRINIGGN